MQPRATIYLLATVGEHSVPGIDLVGLLKKHLLLILKLKTPLKNKIHTNTYILPVLELTVQHAKYM